MYSSFQYRGGPSAGAAGSAAGASPAEEGPPPLPGAAAPAGSAPGAAAAGASPGQGAGAGAAGEGLPFRRGIRLLDSGSVENVLQVGRCSPGPCLVFGLFRRCLLSARALGRDPGFLPNSRSPAEGQTSHLKTFLNISFRSSAALYPSGPLPPFLFV